MKTRVKQLPSGLYKVQVKEGFFHRWKNLADVTGKVKTYIIRKQAEGVASKSEFPTSVYSFV